MLPAGREWNGMMRGCAQHSRPTATTQGAQHSAATKRPLQSTHPSTQRLHVPSLLCLAQHPHQQETPAVFTSIQRTQSEATSRCPAQPPHHFRTPHTPRPPVPLDTNPPASTDPEPITRSAALLSCSCCCSHCRCCSPSTSHRGELAPSSSLCHSAAWSSSHRSSVVVPDKTTRGGWVGG